MTKVFSFVAVALLSVCTFAQAVQVSPSDVTATSSPVQVATTVEGMPLQSMDVSVVSQGVMMAAPSNGCGCGGMYTAMPMAAPACGCAAPVAQNCGCAPVASCGTCCAAPVVDNCCPTTGRRFTLRRRSNDCCNTGCNTCCGTYTSAPVAQNCGCAAPVSTGCCNSCPPAPTCAPVCCPQQTRVRALRSQPVLRGRILGGRRNNCC